MTIPVWNSVVLQKPLKLEIEPGPQSGLYSSCRVSLNRLRQRVLTRHLNHSLRVESESFMAAAQQEPAKLFANLHLEHRVLLPHDEEYKERQDSFWSSYSKSEPACILRPTSATEVATIIKTMKAAGQQFAVRSGGHTQWEGANNIQDGVTVDLQFLNNIKLDEASESVDIGPGARWKEVYDVLKKTGRVVAGGRNGKVGVGGLLLGGGKSFFTGRRGFACDDVVSYEVVLADGRIITADQDKNSDLFMALKGGSGNFGIVTNFRMNCFYCDKIWGGLRVLSKEHEGSALQLLQEFTTEAREDFDSMLLLFLAYSGTYVSIWVKPRCLR